MKYVRQLKSGSVNSLQHKLLIQMKVNYEKTLKKKLFFGTVPCNALAYSFKISQQLRKLY